MKGVVSGPFGRQGVIKIYFVRRKRIIRGTKELASFEIDHSYNNWGIHVESWITSN